MRVFSPRRKPTTCEVAASETFGSIRARLAQELNIPGDRGFLMHQGEAVRIVCAHQRARTLVAASAGRFWLTWRVLSRSRTTSLRRAACRGPRRYDLPARANCSLCRSDVFMLRGSLLSYASSAPLTRAPPLPGALFHGDRRPAEAPTARACACGHVRWNARWSGLRDSSGQLCRCQPGSQHHAAFAAGAGWSCRSPGSGGGAGVFLERVCLFCAFWVPPC